MDLNRTVVCYTFKMFGPKRKAGEKAFKEIDPPITQETYDEFVCSLEHLKKVIQPKLAKEVMVLAEGGDFSENAGYQAAKGKLRGINSRILELETRIKKARIIKKPVDTTTIQLGHTVTFLCADKRQSYTILGSTESNPTKGIISQNSPIGEALMGKRLDEQVSLPIRGKKISCTIVNIE